LELCLFIYLSVLGVDCKNIYIYIALGLPGARKNMRKRTLALAPRRQSQRPSQTGRVQMLPMVAPLHPREGVRLLPDGVIWCIYFLVEHYTSNTEILGMTAGNL
jgi:hypothetical protein